jgi:hypothetical protein
MEIVDDDNNLSSINNKDFNDKNSFLSKYGNKQALTTTATRRSDFLNKSFKADNFLKRQFSTMASKATEPMSATSLLKLINKASPTYVPSSASNNKNVTDEKNEKKNTDNLFPKPKKKEEEKKEDKDKAALFDSNINKPFDDIEPSSIHIQQKQQNQQKKLNQVDARLLTVALSTINELFSSPSLLAGSFFMHKKNQLSLISSNKTELLSSGIDNISSAITTIDAIGLDVEGLEACYAKLFQIGSSVVARLLGSIQQCITELEKSFATLPVDFCLPLSSLRVFLILWQCPLMGNPLMSADVFLRFFSFILFSFNVCVSVCFFFIFFKKLLLFFLK